VSQLTSDALLQIQTDHLQESSNGEVRETVNESSRLCWLGVELSGDVRLKENFDSAGLSIMLELPSKLYANTATAAVKPLGVRRPIAAFWLETSNVGKLRQVAELQTSKHRTY
jgi:hypothetical protein